MMRSILVVSALGALSACASTAAHKPQTVVGFIGLNCPLGWHVSVEGCTPEPGPPLPPLTECPTGSSPLETRDDVDRILCIFGSWGTRTSYIWHTRERRNAERTQSVFREK
jgi:hypothetical protein